MVFDLIDEVLDILTKERWGNELLCIAASTGCMPVIQRLIDRAQHKPDLRTELLRGSLREPQTMSFGKLVHQSIGEAVLGNHIGIVGYLLRQQGIEAHLQHRNSRGENVLHLASRLCNPAMFLILISRFKEGIHQVDNQKETVLVQIIKYSSASLDRYKSAQILLLNGGANRNDYSEDKQQDLLRIATQLGDIDMCHLLICVSKMNPFSLLKHDHNGQTALKEETFENKQNMFAILQSLRAYADAGSTSSLNYRLESTSQMLHLVRD